MRAAILILLTFLSCPFLALIAPDSMPTRAPTLTPTVAVSAPGVEISADATTVRVGDTVTISAVPVRIGLSIYTLTLSSGGSAHVRYDNQEQTHVNDAQFEIVSMQAEMYHARFTLRALSAGSVDVTVSASGEVQDPSGAYSWSGRTSPALTLTIRP